MSAIQQIDYAKFLPPSNNTGKKYHCVSHKRLIAKACVQVLEDKDIHPREKMKAAGILERLGRERDLAARRRKKKKVTKSGTVMNKSQLDSILQQVNGPSPSEN